MKKYFILILLCLLIKIIKSQTLISVGQNGNFSFYSSLDSAINYSVNGDTLYLPPVVFMTNPIIIEKSIHLIGVGHNPDSTQNNITRFTGAIKLKNGAGYGSITGIKLDNGIRVNSSTDVVPNYTINRCNFNGLILSSASTNWVITECVLGDAISCFDSPGSTNFLFSNNIFDTRLGGYGSYALRNSLFRNNIFLYEGSCNWFCFWPLPGEHSIYENNVILSQNYALGGAGFSDFRNNLFVANINLQNDCNCGGINNITNQPQSSIFVNLSGNAFSYTDDYHLKPTCPGVNAGTDGTDIGIYGGSFPWKEGSLPNIPHIKFSSIGASTDNNGNLPVHIEVDAQDL